MGTLATIAGNNLIIAGMVGVFLPVIAINARSLMSDESVEITTSAALITNYILGVPGRPWPYLYPIAATILMTILLAWKTELNKFAGGSLPAEIRSAILPGLIGFMIYPVLPDRYIDPWQLFNPSDAWISVIAIAGIGFVNYALLRVFSTRGIYLGAVFGGLVNSTATIAEVSSRLQKAGQPTKIATLSSLINISMFVRNMVLAAIFVPLSLTSTFIPLLAMSSVAGL